MIDREKFRENFQYYDKDTVIEIIDLFLDDCSLRMDKIRGSIDRADFDELQFSAHSLKGVVAGFMDKDAANYALKLEESAKNKILTGIEENFSLLTLAIEITLRDLTEIRKTL